MYSLHFNFVSGFKFYLCNFQVSKTSSIKPHLLCLKRWKLHSILILHLVYLKYILRACLCTKCAFCLYRSSGTVNTVWTMRGCRSRTLGWAPAASLPSSLPRASACPSIRCRPVSAPAPSTSARSRPPTATYPPTAYPTRTGSVSLTLSISLFFTFSFDISKERK